MDIPLVFTTKKAKKEVEKEDKIAKVSHLISKWYDEGSFVSPVELVSRISKMLRPNQWLRVENARYGGYDYNKPIIYKQKLGYPKPIGIWASKGEWFLHSKILTLLEIDYSRILVLTTRDDYLEFENKYCHKKIIKSDRIQKKISRKS